MPRAVYSKKPFCTPACPTAWLAPPGSTAGREVKDCIAFLRLIQNPADDNSLDRIINVPGRGIGDKTIQQLHEYASSLNVTAGKVLVDLADGEQSAHWKSFGGAAARKLADFGSWLRKWLETKENETLPILFTQVLADTDYRKYIEDESEEGEDRWENVEELLRLSYEYEQTGITAFLENVALVADADTVPERRDAPTLLTLHASKGLEFPVVFIVGLDEKVLPHSRSLDEPEEMAEERRLFYVGITRARDRLYLVRAERRAMYGSYDYADPSRFLADIPAELLNASHRKGETSSRRWGGDDTWGSTNSYRTTQAGNPYRWNTVNQSLPAKPIQSRELKYRVGMHVLHPSWGEGLVLESKFVDEDEIVVVNFETVGLKRLDAALAGLAVLDQK